MKHNCLIFTYNSRKICNVNSLQNLLFQYFKFYVNYVSMWFYNRLSSASNSSIFSVASFWLHEKLFSIMANESCLPESVVR